MKRVICALTALAMLIWACPPARADYKGQLQRGTYTFRIADAGGGTAEMIQEVTKGRLDVGDVRTIPAGGAVEISYTVPAKAERIILVLDPSIAEGQITVTVLSPEGNTIRAPETYQGHTDLVYDIAP